MEGDLAPASVLHGRLHQVSEERNRLNRNVMVDELTLMTEVSHGRTLIQDSSLKLVDGNKYGLVGRNGVGKTTLMRALADHRIPGMYEHMRCAFVDDGSSFIVDQLDATALDFLLAQHKQRTAALEELKTLLEADADVDVDELDDICQRLRHANSDRAHADASRILSGLGIDPEQSLATLSGGWRHRVALATALFVDCDLLLLDEPTRSLDLLATLWLERFIESMPTTVVVVSHDIEFLDSIATHIIQLDDLKLSTFPGNFTAYQNSLAAQQAHQRKMYNAQETRRRRWQSTIDRLQQRAAAVGDGGKQIRSRKHSLEKRIGEALDGTYWKYGLMGPRPEVTAVTAVEPVSFELQTDISDVPEGDGAGETTLIRFENVCFAFSDAQPLIVDASLEITLSTRMALIGPNGAGKSTLLDLISGKRDPTGGSPLRWDGLRVAHIAQDAAKVLRSDSNPLRWLQAQHQALSSDEAVEVLKGFGLATPSDLSTPVSNLSDGQRTRLILASVQCQQPHLLLLDEPTGHLDPDSAAALASALDFFDGAVIVASHDRTFLRSFDPQLVELAVGRPLKVLTDDIDAYCSKHFRPAAAPGVPKTQRTAPSAVTAQKATVDVPDVHCRRCGGPHFTFSCPTPAEATSAPASGAAKPAKPRSAEVRVPRVKSVATGQGQWRVAVSKEMLKKMAHQK